MSTELHTMYKEKSIPALKEQFGYANVMQVPAIDKVVVNVGYGRHNKDKAYIENVHNTLRSITGQQPVSNLVSKSISNFKIREGANVGASVTLRGDAMYEFLYKLINLTLPRVRDFRGISPKAFDKAGNYTIGFKENIAFPEITADAIEKIHGLQVVISTTANNKEEGSALLKSLGFPFRDK